MRKLVCDMCKTSFPDDSMPCNEYEECPVHITKLGYEVHDGNFLDSHQQLHPRTKFHGIVFGEICDKCLGELIDLVQSKGGKTENMKKMEVSLVD